MRIDHLQITNFKSFEANDFTFHPQFNLIIGDNGTGKTSLLDALVIAAGSWLLGIGGGESRHIRHDEIMLQCFTFESSECRWEQRLPCRVDAKGVVQGHVIRWGREIEKEGGRTKYADANAIKALAVAAEADVLEGESVDDTRSSKRYDTMKEHAKHYLELLEEAAMAPEEKLEAFKAQLADTIAPFADNPAYQGRV